MRTRRSLALVLVALALLAAAYRGWSYLNQPAVLLAKREARALAAKGPVHLAAVWPHSERTHFINGIQLAVDECTQAGRPSGRPLVVHEFDESSPYRGMRIARKIRRNLDIVAVIGHYWREAALRASVTYEDSGVCFVATGTSSAMLCSHGFRYVVQSLPDDIELARALAGNMVQHDIGTLSILYVRNLFGRKLANAVIEQASDAGVSVVHRAAYSELQVNFLPIIADVRSAGPQGVMLIDSPARAKLMVSQMVLMGVEATIIGGPPLEDPKLAKVVAGTSLQLRVLTVFSARDTTERVQQFVANYTTRFGEQPSWEAAYAYEAVLLIVQAIERSGTAAPLSLTTMLKYGGPWQCLMGPCSFDSDGRITDRKVHYMKAEDGYFTEDLDVDSWLPVVSSDGGPSGN